VKIVIKKNHLKIKSRNCPCNEPCLIEDEQLGPVTAKIENITVCPQKQCIWTGKCTSCGKLTSTDYKYNLHENNDIDYLILYCRNETIDNEIWGSGKAFGLGNMRKYEDK